MGKAGGLGGGMGRGGGEETVKREVIGNQQNAMNQRGATGSPSIPE